MKKYLSRQPYFIFLLPLFYLLNTLNEYYPVLKAGNIFHPVSLLIITITILLYILVSFITPKLTKYALLVLYLEIFYFFFGTIHFFFKENISFLSHYKYLLPILAGIAILIFWLIRKSSRVPYRTFLYLNTVLLLLIALETSRCFIKNGNYSRSELWSSQKQYPAINSSTCDSCFKPDIYFIIFDGYSASRTLRDYWGFDNSDLDSFFHQEGFYYADRSRSNYNFTPYSIGSILNMDYHTSKPDHIDIRQFCKGISTIKGNRACEILQKNNYTIINQSYFSLLNEKPALDISYAASKKRLLFSQTLISKINNDIGWNFPLLRSHTTIEEELALGKIHFEQVKKAYRTLLETSAKKNQQPVFVYTHFLTPHDPYIYDSTGKPTPDSTWYSAINSKERYLSSLKYTNMMIKNLVTHLKREGNRPRIIIIQSDHGFRDFQGKELQDLEFNNLNAIYFPDQDYDQLYDSISSVNTFPILFNKYFHTSIPLLKDSNIYIPH